MATLKPVVRVEQVHADSHGFTTTCVTCSSIAFLVWDTLINFDKEMENIWQRPGGWVKWMYLFIRHPPYLAQCAILFMIVSTDLRWESKQCEDWLIYQGAIMESLTVAVEIVLIVRIYAMYYRTWFVIVSVYVLFVAEIVAMCTILAVTIPKFEFTPQCLVTAAPKLFSTYWTISLVFETTLFALTLIKFFADIARRQVHKQSLMFVLIKDGTWAYAIIFVIMLLNTLLYGLEKSSLTGMFFVWELSIMSFAGSHVLLNLREFSKDNQENPFFASRNTGARVASHLPPLSDLRFVLASGSTTVSTELTTVEDHP